MAQKEYMGATDLLLLVQLIYTEVNKYVLKVEGKGLSEENFTAELKTKLEGIDPAQYVPVTGGTFTGAVYVPTADAGTSNTRAASTEFVNTAVNNALADITGIKFDGPYDSLAALQTAHPTGADGVIYLVRNGGADPNSKDEYFWDSGESKYEIFGTTTIDLSGYLLADDVQEMSADDVQAVWTSVFGS